MIGATPVLTAIMTGSPLGPAITSALAFFNRRMKALELHEHEKALAHLNLTADESVKAKRLRLERERELDVGQPTQDRPG